MKKIIICVISAIMTIAGVGGKVLVDNKTEKVDNQIPQVVESIVDSSKEELEKATEDVVEKSDEEKSEEKKEETEKKENDSQTTTKEKTTDSKQVKDSSVSNNQTQKQSVPQKNETNVTPPKVEEKKPEQTNTNNQQNKVSTTFYDSITHGIREYRSESEAIARGNQIIDNELNYVLDWNEANPDNQIQPTINYYRIYPSAIDENGGYWYYLHFFTTKGEGQDSNLKSRY